MRLSLLGKLAVVLICACCSTVLAQKPKPNYDEAKVPKYRLPSPFIASDQTTVIETAEQWMSIRRPELLNLFRKEMFGQMPGVNTKKIKFEEISNVGNALGGKATRKEIRIYFNAPEKEPKADMLVYIPNRAKKPVAAFLGMNFKGNHAVTLETDVLEPGRVQGSRIPADQKIKRGEAVSRWPIEKIIDRGYALATIYYEEIAPDNKEDFKLGVYRTFPKEMQERKGDAPMAISTWAWGLSRGLDALGTLKDINQKKVIVFGHSRLGKTALWAGANDTRFAGVISNNSGCGGAALSRREYGETVATINDSFPHWFCENFKKYGKDVNSLPFDQHELIGLIALRPVYIASAEGDRWADPKGEFLSALKADPIYRLNRTGGFGDVTRWQPPINTSVGDVIRYHVRTGKHDVTDFDWEQYLKFADERVR